MALGSNLQQQHALVQVFAERDKTQTAKGLHCQVEAAIAPKRAILVIDELMPVLCTDQPLPLATRTCP